tara:strand:+ start:114 stop:509 length:396 start_codon:yes stop_codon:yes gene_type:complete
MIYLKPKILDFNTKLSYHMSGCIASIRWSTKNCFFTIVFIDRKVKFLCRKNNFNTLLYVNTDVKILAVGLFVFSSYKAKIQLDASKFKKGHYKIRDNNFNLSNNSKFVMNENLNFSIQSTDFEIVKLKPKT